VQGKAKQHICFQTSPHQLSRIYPSHSREGGNPSCWSC